MEVNVVPEESYLGLKLSDVDVDGCILART